MRFIVMAAIVLSAPANAQESEEKHGASTLKIIKDPMTDAARGILVVPGEQIRMVVKCDDPGPGSLYVSFISTRYLGSLRYNNRDIKYRIDGAPPQNINAYHDKSTATIMDVKPETRGGQWFAQVLGAAKLTVQVSSYDYDQYTQVFDLSGFRQGAARAAAVCLDSNWYMIR